MRLSPLTGLLDYVSVSARTISIIGISRFKGPDFDNDTIDE